MGGLVPMWTVCRRVCAVCRPRQPLLSGVRQKWSQRFCCWGVRCVTQRQLWLSGR